MLQHLRFNEKDHLLSNVSDMIPHPLQLSDDRQQIQRLSNVVRIIANVIRNDPRSLAIDFFQDHILIKNGTTLVYIIIQVSFSSSLDNKLYRVGHFRSEKHTSEL